MTNDPIHLVLIVGSMRHDRFTPTVASWFADQVAQRWDIALDVVDLPDAPLGLYGPTLRPSEQDSATLARTIPLLAKADAYVVVTPEYNHSFPAGVKNFVDWHLTEWRAKAVGFVSHGGMAGGLRAVEGLRAVFAELHAVTVRDTVSFHGGPATFDDQGRPLDPEPCAAAAKVLLDQLLWWALALREARRRRPYQE
jgi:NAD(P)H-dependent FMN reductase